ncbi:MAG: sulfatase [Planctomycetota bacterium]
MGGRAVILGVILALGGLARAEEQAPNIVLMLADDQSWMGTSVRAHPDVAPGDLPFHTPHLERLAAQSMRFTSAYAPAPKCAPSRASIMTGMNPARLGWTTQGRNGRDGRRGLGALQDTFAELLQDAGYRTAHFGKWHIQGGGPEAHGFDVSDGNIGNEAAGQYADPNPTDIFGMAERAESFMRSAHREGRPFFVQLSWLALHAPQNALESTKARYNATTDLRRRDANRLALTEDLDTGVGRVLNAIEQLGLTGTTYVIYMSDNGGQGAETAPLRGGKGNIYEGGIRVPLLIRGPGIEANSWCHAPVVGYDLFPTFTSWAGVTLDQSLQLDGGSLAALARGDAAQVDRRSDGLVFHYHSQSALHVDGYKLLVDLATGTAALYDLGADIGEQHDLSSDLPDRRAAMQVQLSQALQEMGIDPSDDTAGRDRATRDGDTQRRRGRRDRDASRSRER